MKIRQITVAVCIAGASLGLVACKSSDTATASTSEAAMAVKADNTMCPVGGGPVADSVSPIAYKGKNVGFCCAGCAGKFAKMSDSEKDAMLAKMK
jgi:hypothetical protein